MCGFLDISTSFQTAQQLVRLTARMQVSRMFLGEASWRRPCSKDSSESEHIEKAQHASL